MTSDCQMHVYGLPLGHQEALHLSQDSIHAASDELHGSFAGSCRVYARGHPQGILQSHLTPISHSLQPACMQQARQVPQLD